MKLRDSEIWFEITPTELEKITQEFKRASEEVIERVKQGLETGEVCIAPCCENISTCLRFVWKPEIKDNKVMNF